MRAWLLCSIALLAALPLLGNQDDAKAKKKKRSGGFNPSARLLKDVELTADQKKDLRELSKEFQPKFQAAQKKMAGIVPQEKLKAAAAATKKARESGTTGKDLQKVREDALGLTGDKIAEYAKANKERNELFGQFREKVMALLTAEQKKNVKSRPGGDAPKKKRKKKKKDA
ncbi:MAG: hypothetical protein N2C14_09485 [Planctomycetales bacterium]